MLKNKKGQSTLEYIILVTAVVAVLLVFLAPGKGVFSTTLNTSLGKVSNGMGRFADRIVTSYPTK